MFTYEEATITNPSYNLVKQYNLPLTHVRPTESANVKPWILPIYYKKMAKELYELEVYEDDVWVISFPKTGTTWTQEMVWMIANDLDYVQAKRINLARRFPFLEMSIFNERRASAIKLVENMSRPRFIKTHLPAALLPKQLWTRKPKIVYVTRNPKDVAISYFHHTHGVDEFSGSIEEFFELFLRDLIPYGPFINHTLDFWKLRNEKNISFHTYEDMKSDLPAIIRQTCAFLGKSISDEEIIKLSEHLSFKSMKENDAIKFEEQNSTFQILRKGESGSFKNVMSTDMIGNFDKWTSDGLKDSDFKFQY